MKETKTRCFIFACISSKSQRTTNNGTYRWLLDTRGAAFTFIHKFIGRRRRRRVCCWWLTVSARINTFPSTNLSLRPRPNQLYLAKYLATSESTFNRTIKTNLSTRLNLAVMSLYSKLFDKMTHLRDYKDMKDVPSLLLYRRHTLFTGRQILARSPWFG